MAPESTTDLARPADENRLIREKLAARPSSSRLAPEETLHRAKDLMKKIPPLLEKKDGPALLRILRDLAALGEPGYPAALFPETLRGEMITLQILGMQIGIYGDQVAPGK